MRSWIQARGGGVKAWSFVAVSLVDLVQELGVEHLLVQRRDELVFQALARDEHLVLARAARGIEAAVVAAARCTSSSAIGSSSAMMVSVFQRG